MPFITDLALAKRVSQPVFIRVEPSAGVKPGDSYAYTVVLRSGPDHMPVGGSTYRFECVPSPKEKWPATIARRSVPGLLRVDGADVEDARSGQRTARRACGPTACT